jgi:hypothetical protein
MLIKWVTDPALTDTPTLVIYISLHEFYFWREGRKPCFLYYRNGDYVKGSGWRGDG